MVKNEVPSFISSETILPRRRATTPYTFPRTSAGDYDQFVLGMLSGEENEEKRRTHSKSGCHRYTLRA